MNKIFVENAQHYYDLRKKAEFKRTNVKTVYNGTKTLTFLGPRIWEIVPDYTKKVTVLMNSKGSYHKLVFLNFLGSIFYHIYVKFLFVNFKSVLCFIEIFLTQ